LGPSKSEDYISKAVGHYSSLFILPSLPKMLLLLFLVCVLGGVPSSHQGLISGLFFGTAFFLITISVDYAVYHVFIMNDPIINLKRFFGLSLASAIIWFGFILVGSALSFFLKNLDIWIKVFLLGFFATLILRLIVLFTASFCNPKVAVLSALLQPALCNLSLFPTGYALDTRFLPFFPISILVAVLVTVLFVTFINSAGKKKFGVTTSHLFKAFLVNWAGDLNRPLEEVFEKIGEERDVKVSLLAFGAKGRIKAIMVVPALHPGPFKNVGSSPLPFMIQTALENKLECIAPIPHGLSGHDLDLASQLQNKKILEGILEHMNFSSFNATATTFVRANADEVKASCQIFGNCALITLTLAPQTMEDLPPELDFMIVKEAEKRGLSSAIVVDAHNSIEGPYTKEVATLFRRAAITSLKKALSLNRSPFEVGMAKVLPKGISVADGMGPGGIITLVIKVGEQKTAYITIDGNNMVSGLREKILLELREIGVTDGEVLTTDTHVVNGIRVTKRGYHPVGEAMDQEGFINSVRQATVTALKNMEPAEASWFTMSVPSVKVLGEKQVRTLCLIADETTRQAKKLALSLLPMAGILLTLLLALF
jgi:putative membrane protein